MAENNLTADVAGISWAAAAGASAQETARDEKDKAPKVRRRAFQSAPDAGPIKDEQLSSEGAHEIDSFA